MTSKHKITLVIIFLIVLSLRLYFSFSTPLFESDESYFNLRQIESIESTGKPTFSDELSYGSRIFLFPPLFHYILAIVNTLVPIILVGKIIPNIFASSMVFISYLIAHKITNNKTAGIVIAIITSSIPIFLTETYNSVSVQTLAIPVFFLGLYSILNIDQKIYSRLFIVITLIFPLISITSLTLTLTTALYFIYQKVSNIKLSKRETEVILLNILYTIWFTLILYKKAIFTHGISTIFNNVPTLLSSQYFTIYTIPQAIIAISLIPFFIGAFSIYRYTFKQSSKNFNLLLSCFTVIFTLMFFKIIDLDYGTTMIGITLSIMTSFYIKSALIYFQKTKFSKHYSIFVSSIIIISLVLTTIPGIIQMNNTNNIPQIEKIQALLWIKDNTKKEAKVLSLPEDGFLINYVANRKNQMDYNFRNIENINEKYKNLEDFYKTQYTIRGLDYTSKNKITYIMITPQIKQKFNIDDLKINDICFKKKYDKTTIIYEVKC